MGLLRLSTTTDRVLQLCARTATTLVIACACGHALPRVAVGQSNGGAKCRAKSPISLTDTSVGPLVASATLAVLRSLCSAAYDTTLLDPASSGSEYPGLAFPFKGATIIALQYRAVTLKPHLSADGWIVTGSVRLPSGAPLDGRWSRIYRDYPAIQASAGFVLVVRLCALPNVLLTLDTDPNLVRDPSGLVDLARIPKDARVLQAFILSKQLGHSLSPC